ncbi:YicC family protein [Halobacillus shinanisalinarum]|uniref:YicC family protein n=1 Tax=Halobacillus shinanisalinarum TaxID=2932258 RepID=A0ABY4GYS4_9BACI|nr:YicC/YloC family endoribonuclease [Halobacillus shinanisalinarum]UOQ93166.1 YicC family protein [Halobacillus shinanisalinarum]
MTGYGQRTVEADHARLTIELRGVNHRFLDISPKIPRSFLFLEEAIKRQIKDKLHRGRIDVYLTVEGENLVDKRLEADDLLLDQYINKLNSIKEQYRLTGEISIDMVTRLDGIFTVEERDHTSDDMKEAILEALNHSIDDLVEMRSQEGLRLGEDLINRLAVVKGIVADIEERRPVVMNEYKDKIFTRIETFVREEIDPEETRVLQEVAMLAEKGDITEEVTRLYSHIDQFDKTLQKSGSIGRTLDFIVQEMHREINTIGSKSNDSQLSNGVVALKSEVEKMKEQLQNIE